MLRMFSGVAGLAAFCASIFLLIRHIGNRRFIRSMRRSHEREFEEIDKRLNLNLDKLEQLKDQDLDPTIGIARQDHRHALIESAYGRIQHVQYCLRVARDNIRDEYSYDHTPLIVEMLSKIDVIEDLVRTVERGTDRPVGTFTVIEGGKKLSG